MIGSQISHYRILERLGGSTGVVYRAEDTRDQSIVAFRFLPFDLRDDQQARDAFVDEAQASSALDHPAISKIVDIGDAENGRMYVAMPFYEGENLEQRLEHGALPVDEAIRIVRRVAKGLCAAHERGIVHRDVKPANIILTEDGGLKIVDFGLARVVSRGQPGLTQIGASMGTPTYMSPEQTLGDDIDRRSDLWSLGVVFYQCLTGRLPFEGKNLPTVIQAIHSKDPEPPSALREGIPAHVEAAVLRLLEKKPEDRFGSCGELIDVLSEDGEGEGESAAPAAPNDADAASDAKAESSDTATKSGTGCLFFAVAPLLAAVSYWLL